MNHAPYTLLDVILAAYPTDVKGLPAESVTIAKTTAIIYS